jgi:molecular chaperone DnaK
VPVDAQGAFEVALVLAPRRANAFTLAGRDAAGAEVALDPAAFSVFHGLTVGDPPLSRSVGVALASDAVREFFPRGAPLPARRTFVQRTVEPLSPAAGGELRIPIVQGEHAAAHLCRLIGALAIPAAELSAPLPTGAEVELTLELDRGGRLSARARVVATGQVFAEVAQLVVPEATPEALGAAAEALAARLAQLRAGAAERGAAATLAGIAGLEAELADAEQQLAAARGGDADAAQKARRALSDVEAALDAAEEELAWPELVDDANDALLWASGWVRAHGSPTEQRLLENASTAILEAQRARRPGEVERQLRVVRRLGHAAMFRDPDIWDLFLEDAASRADEATDLAAAGRAVARGRAARDREDRAGVRAAVEALWKLLPPDAQRRRLSHGSGVE